MNIHSRDRQGAVANISWISRLWFPTAVFGFIQPGQNLGGRRGAFPSQHADGYRNQHRGLETLAAHVADQHDARATGSLQHLVEVPANFQGREVDGLDAVQVPRRGQRGQQERLDLGGRCQFPAQALASTSSRAERWFIRMVITNANSSPVIVRANVPCVAITLVGEKNGAP